MISKAGNKKGFVFIEICIVVVLILVLLSISWPVFNTMAENLILRLNSKKIVVLLNNVREKAVLESRYYILEFDIPSNRYFVKSLNEDSDTNELEVVKQDYIIKKEFKDRLMIKTVSVNKLIFNPDGTSEDFSLELETNKERFMINMEGLSGKCKIEKI